MTDVSRRALFGAGLLAAGAVGVGAGVATGHSARSSRGTTSDAGAPAPGRTVLPSALLLSAIERESALLERLDGAVAANPALAASATVLQADHRAHRQALQALLRPTTAPTSSASPTATTPPATLSSTAQLIGWESAAAAAAARDCAAAPAGLAPLLASISACEASHAAWLA